jgi:hypothetical protein
MAVVRILLLLAALCAFGAVLVTSAKLPACKPTGYDSGKCIDNSKGACCPEGTEFVDGDWCKGHSNEKSIVCCARGKGTPKGKGKGKTPAKGKGGKGKTPKGKGKKTPAKGKGAKPKNPTGKPKKTPTGGKGAKPKPSGKPTKPGKTPSKGKDGKGDGKGKEPGGKPGKTPSKGKDGKGGKKGPWSRADAQEVAHAWLQHKPMFAMYPKVKQYISRGKGLYRPDCSGFVSACWNIPPPGSVTYTIKFKKISRRALKRGDALLCNGCYNGIHHLALFWGYAKDGRAVVVEEYNYGHPVTMRAWSNSWFLAFMPIRRPGWN